MNAQAAVLREPTGSFEVEDIELPEPQAGEVLVKVVSSGVCHTDLMARKLPPGSVHLPMIFGHEGTGVVAAVGTDVSAVSVGDHVVLSYDSCGACAQCMSGRPSYCAHFVDLNLEGRYADASGGATDKSGAPVANRWFGQSSFATLAVATARNVVPVDRSLPLELLGPLGCGVMTGAGTVLRGLRMPTGASLGVFGAGAVGLSAVMASKLAGASTIVAVDVIPRRLELARELGATHTFDGSDPDVAEQVAAVSGGLDFALDTTAVPAVVDTAVRSLGIGGTCALVGVGGADISLEPSLLASRSLRYLVMGESVPQSLVPMLIDFWQQGRFPFDKLIEKYSFDRVDEALQDVGAGRTIKPVLVMP